MSPPQVWPSMFAAERVHLVPGNHDVNSDAPTAPGFKAQLAHYRSAFGRDYHSFKTQCPRVAG